MAQQRQQVVPIPCGGIHALQLNHGLFRFHRATICNRRNIRGSLIKRCTVVILPRCGDIAAVHNHHAGVFHAYIQTLIGFYALSPNQLNQRVKGVYPVGFRLFALALNLAHVGGTVLAPVNLHHKRPCHLGNAVNGIFQKTNFHFVSPIFLVRATAHAGNGRFRGFHPVHIYLAGDLRGHFCQQQFAIPALGDAQVRAHRLHRHQAGFRLRIHADLLAVVIRRKGQCNSDLAFCLSSGVGVHNVGHNALYLIIRNFSNRAHCHFQHAFFVHDLGHCTPSLYIFPKHPGKTTGAVEIIKRFLGRLFQGPPGLRVKMHPQRRLIVVAMAQPYFQAVPFGQFPPPAAKQDVMFFQPPRGVQVIPFTAQVTFALTLQDAFCHACAPPGH
nr:MAG TPA: hypothetical protein [Bacteriophage sp.]